MTNFEFMKTIPDEHSFVKWLKENYHAICEKEYTHKDRCMADEYRGMEGCKRCHIDWLKSEMKQ